MVKVCADRTYQVGDRQFQGFYLDWTLKQNIDNYLIPAVKKRWDGVVLCTGMEGSGKTTLMMTIGHYIQPNFCIDNVVFTQDQLMEQIDKGRPGDVILFDEAAMAALAQDAASAVQIALIKKFVTIRKKNLYIFLIIPSIFMLRRYFAVFRTRALIHAYSPDGLSRGFFKFYGYDTKRLLYIRGVKEFDQSCVRADFTGRFTNTFGFFIDEKEYDAKKEEAIRSIGKKDSAEEKPSRKLELLRAERNLFLLAAFKLAKFHHDKKFALEKERGEAFPDFSYKVFSAFMLQHFCVNVKHTQVGNSIGDALQFLRNEEQRQVQNKRIEEELKKL